LVPLLVRTVLVGTVLVLLVAVRIGTRGLITVASVLERIGGSHGRPLPTVRSCCAAAVVALFCIRSESLQGQEHFVHKIKSVHAK
jgi:hypothetical protein